MCAIRSARPGLNAQQAERDLSENVQPRQGCHAINGIFNPGSKPGAIQIQARWASL